MLLKPQDLFVSLKLCLLASEPRWTYAQLAEDLGLSHSEANAATRRDSDAGLLTRERGRSLKPRPVRGALLEFIEHGVRYAFYVSPGEQTRGTATAHSAPPMNQLIQADSESPFIWPDAEGDLRGQAIRPLYPSVPSAARRDPALHELLALVDAVRVGRSRERKLACAELKRRLFGESEQ